MFDVVYSLKKLQLDRDLRLGIPTLFLEFLQWLILIFGPEWDWDVDWSNRYGRHLASHFMFIFCYAQRVFTLNVLLQLVETLQPLATAACSCTAESSCLSGRILPDDSSGCLHLGGLCIHTHAD